MGSVAPKDGVIVKYNNIQNIFTISLPKTECKLFGNRGCLYMGLLLHLTYIAQLSECSLLIGHLASDLPVVVTFLLTSLLILQEFFAET